MNHCQNGQQVKTENNNQKYTPEQNEIIKLAESGKLYNNPKYDMPTSIKDALSKNINNVYNLDLSSDSLIKLPDTLSVFINLETLHLNYNSITDFKVLNQLPNLKTLALQYCQLNMIPKEIFNLYNLEELFIGGNNISEIPKEITQLKKLKKLWIPQNKLTSLPSEISQLTQLEELFLGNNLIEEFPEEITKLENLRKLYLNMNDISGWIPDSIYYLKNLEELNLSMTKGIFVNQDSLKKYLPNCKLIISTL